MSALVAPAPLQNIDETFQVGVGIGIGVAPLDQRCHRVLQLPQFLPLAYFPIDPDYNVPASLKPLDDPTVYEMPTSTGANRSASLPVRTRDRSSKSSMILACPATARWMASAASCTLEISRTSGMRVSNSAFT